MMPNILFHMHIPKTAGTALSQALKRAVSPEEFVPWFPQNPYEINAWLPDLEKILVNRPNARIISGHFIYGAHRALKHKNYKYITSVRDPVARLLSHYVHDVHHNLPLFEQNNAKSIIFSQFISDYVSQKSVTYYYNNVQTRFISGIVHQYFNGMPDNEIVDFCIEIIKKDFVTIARQNTLASDAKTIFEELGIKAPDIRDENSLGRYNPAHILLPQDFTCLQNLNRLDCQLLSHVAPDIVINSTDAKSGSTERFKDFQLESYRSALVNLINQNRHLRNIKSELERKIRVQEQGKSGIVK